MNGNFIYFYLFYKLFLFTFILHDRQCNVMMIKSFIKSIQFFLLFISLYTHAQNSNSNSHSLTIQIPEVALLNIYNSSNNSITLNSNSVSEAGKPLIINDFDDSIWLNYSSIIGSQTKPSRSISLQITDGSVPEGLQLTVKIKNDAGKGAGKMGVPTISTQIVKNIPVKIIEQIGSSYTGVGPHNGHNLHYTLTQTNIPESYALLNYDQSQSIAITYTLSDN
ncbi:MAG: hypothetical protein Q8S44_07635 [Flavobacteriaceae bacterium]|nr:hypothetical protein [Flavobacteriaceae bacterium]